MKLAAIYSVWNGLELLEPSIAQIEEFTDEIVICWQKVSNKGEVNPSIESFIERFSSRPKFHLLEFVPNLSKNTKQNERDKLQLRIDYAKKLGCTHFFSSATDHFYKSDEFRFCKWICDSHGYDVTFTKMFTYYKHPTWQITPIEDYNMPFICKLYPETSVIRTSNYPVKVDPSIQVNTCKSWRLFRSDEIMMHHYSMIRVDIRNKFRNAAASIRWKPDAIERFVSEYETYSLESNTGISYFQGRKVKEVSDWFGLSRP